MAYTKQNFESGQILKAEHLNNIENGITEIEKNMQPKGEYLTEIPENYVTDEELNNKGYLTEHQKLKTINGNSIVGTGNIMIEGGSGQAINYDLNVKAINHRGYSAEAPENTIPAYIMSKNKGFTYVECDVSFTSDSVAVLLHDATIDRTSDGSGSISNMTYEKALTYDFGSWFSEEYKGVKIPTFTEFITLCKRLGLHPYIELKSNGSYTQTQITQIVNEVKDCGMEGKVTYISFDEGFLGYVKNADSSARLGLLVNPINSTEISRANALKTDTNEVFMDAKLSTLTSSLINLCKTNNLPLEVWTVNTEKEIKEMPNYISGVTSDMLVAGKILYEEALNYNPPVSDYVPATSITLDKNTLTFETSDTQTLVATVTPSNASDEIVWKSSNESVATVVDGVVTPRTDGNCAITATAGGVSTSCSVTVAFAITQYTITKNLTGCKGSSSAVVISEGASYTETFTADEFYTLDNASVVVTMGGVDISSKYVDGTLNISSVTGNIVITITAVEIITYSITRNLTNCSSSSDVVTIVEGSSHTETFTIIDGYTLDNVTIMMGNTDISSKYVDGTLTIESVTGDIVITITAIREKAIIDYAFNIGEETAELINNGTGGSTYNTTVVGEYDTTTTDKVVLLNGAYASVNYPITKNDEFTIRIRGAYTELNSSNTYQRLFRADTDALCSYYAISTSVFGTKMNGTSNNIKKDSTDANVIFQSGKNSIYMNFAKLGNDTHDHVLVGNGTTIYYYVDGELIAHQRQSDLVAITAYTIGNSDKTKEYNANKISISKWQIYDYAMTADEVTALV